MNDEIKKLIRDSNINVSEIRLKRIQQQEKRRKQIENLVKKAQNNSKLFLKNALKSILSAHEKLPTSVGRIDNTTVIKIEIEFLKESNTDYFGKEKELSEIYNNSVKVSKPEELIYYFKNDDTYEPVIIDLDSLKDLEIFDSIELNSGGLTLTASQKKIHGLLVNANCGRCLLDEEIINMLKKTYRNICNKRLELQFFRKSLLKNSEIIYYDIFKKLCKEYENNPEAEKYIASTMYTLPSYISDESETVNLAKLYNNSKIDLNNTIVFYPLKKEITNKLKTETITEWIPFSIKDLNDNIKSDLPSTEFHYPNNNIPVYSYIDYHVNAYEFESLLIKIQTQEDTEQDIENPKQK